MGNPLNSLDDTILEDRNDDEINDKTAYNDIEWNEGDQVEAKLMMDDMIQKETMKI